MSFQHEYPYGDVHELNLDWIMQTMLEFINSEREAGNTPTVSSVRSFFTHKYPYGDIHELNLDWVIQTALRMEEIGDSVEGDIGELQTRMTAAETNISTLENTVGGLSDSIGQIETVIEDIQDDVEDLQATVAQHTTQIAALDQKIDTQVVANPAEAATDTLSKIEIAGTVYEVEGSGGSEVEANPAGEATGTLQKIGIDGTIYGVGGSEPVSKTATGNPINITDAADAPIVSGTVAFEPVQDLHGYDKPWAGGAGKNKLETILADIKTSNTDGTWSGNAYTINGITFTVEIDNDLNVVGIKVNGTASQETIFNVGLTPATGTFVMSGCPNGGSVSTYSVYAKSLYVHDYGTGENITPSGTQVTVAIVIRNGYTANNLMFYPMIRLATETDPTFEPYSNICPITGYDDCELEVTDDATSPTVTKTYTIDLDGTRYGGKVNMVSGEMWVDRACFIGDGSSDENWNITGTGRLQLSDISNLKQYTDITNEYLTCSIAVKATSTANTGVITYSSGKLVLYLEGFKDGTLEDWKTYLSSNPVYICYELDTPFTVQLTPEQIRTLEGTNNISSNMTSMTVEYITLDYQPLVKLIERSAGHHYSTDEHVIGTWIDGKTLYEKVFSVTLPTFEYSQWTVIDSAELSNVSELVACHALKNTSTQSALPTTFTVIGSVSNSNKLQVMNLLNVNYGQNIPARVIVQYTKTTD